tara:strand:- start:1693 stop:2436 length:744 start_codon:yes stop_codon:yes gene_type:complete
MPNSFKRFQDQVMSGYKTPSKSNLFEVRVQIPASVILKESTFGTERNSLEHVDAMNYFASAVTVPGRRVTTSEVRDIGVSRKYATNTAFGDLQIEFLVTKDQYHRDFFETWMQSTASDAENRVGLYEEYTSNISVLKWENASNVVYSDPTNKQGAGHARLNRSSAVWQMYGAFPYDMSEQSFDNGPTGLVKLNVNFFFERYRFDKIGNKNAAFGKVGMKDVKVSNTTEIANQLGFVLEQKDVASVGV